MSWRIPWSRNTCTFAVSRAEGSFESGTKCTALEKRSTIVSTTVLPSEGGRPVTKSTAMCDHGRCGTGRGRRRPAGARCDDLPRAQMEQAATKPLVSSAMEDHQNRCRRRERQRRNPGWQTTLDSCPHWRMAVRAAGRINIRHRGQPCNSAHLHSSNKIKLI